MKWLTDFANEIGKIVLDAAKLLFSKSVAAFAIAVLLTLAAALIGAWSITRADRYQRLVEAALGKSTENTPQTMKALESLILAYVETDENGKEILFKKNVEMAALSEQLRSVLAGLDAGLRATNPVTSRRLALVRADVSAHDAVISEPPEKSELLDHGFLFFPARLIYPSEQQFLGIRTGTSRIESALGIERVPESLEECDQSEPERLCDDVLTTRRLVESLVNGTGATVAASTPKGVGATPVQAYVITENGINRIVSSKGKDYSRYSEQFNAAMSFPSRPYYLGAIADPNRRKANASLLQNLTKGMPLGGENGYFYVSEPYLDIGGNGIVVTLARAFSYAGHSQGVLAFDLTVADYPTIQAKLEEMVRGLDGVTAVASCSVPAKGDPDCGPKPVSGDDNLFKQEKEKLHTKLRVAGVSGSASDIAGNINLLSIEAPTEPAPIKAGVTDVVLNRILDVLGRLIAHESKEIRFTVPVEPRQLQDGGDKNTLLIASLNVGRFLQNTAIASALALFLFGIAITVVLGSFVTEAKLRDVQAEERKKLDEAARKEREDLRTALANVATVMQAVEAPYVRLDNDDYVIDGNDALAEFLGLAPTKLSVDAQVVHTRFEDWLADEASKTRYRKVQKLRQEGKPVEPYDLTFRRARGTPRTARVVSSVVPATQKSSDGMPETFGILVPKPSVENET